MGRPRAGGEAVTPIWLAHHFPEDYERCTLVGRRHVCRRCLAIYPVAFVVLGAAMAGLAVPAAWDPWLMVLLPIPGVIEFVLEQLGLVRYSAWRTWLVMVPLGAALGVGFSRYVDHPGDGLFWGVVLGYGVICGLSVLWRWTRRR